MLAAFAVMPSGRSFVTAPAAVAVAYLRLHRTRAITVTQDTLAFGFRAASTADAGRVPRLAEVADLDLLQARRHARFLAGHTLAADLHALREAAPGLAARGLTAVESGWADRPPRARGAATMIDVGDDSDDLADSCGRAGVVASAASMASDVTAGLPAEPWTAERLAAAAAERALVIALACARGLGRYCWEGTICTARVMAATAWDVFPSAAWDDASCEQPASSRQLRQTGAAVIITSSGGTVPARVPGTTTVAAVDVEWSKNYRVKNGNIPFCYSVIWLSVPASCTPVNLDGAAFSYTSVYVDNPAETQDLIASAGSALARVLDRADLVTGHQLCSDLATLARAAGHPPDTVSKLRAAWHQRQLPASSQPRIIDTRYDIGNLLSGTSRRLVDVCAELRLDVTQPELRGTSMTALHRRWTETGDSGAREKISVLNLRHSLSTALAAIYTAGIGRWEPGLNVNQMLASGLGDAFAWTAAPAFRALLEDRR